MEEVRKEEQESTPAVEEKREPPKEEIKQEEPSFEEENVITTKSAADSEYESLHSADSGNEHEEGEILSDSGQSEEEDIDEDEAAQLEREEGDGQESLPAKKVDDDEDKKNPQYIPKRGTFYEHDDRTLEEDDPQEAEKTEKPNKKNVWIEKKERWIHDKFNECEQSPKSPGELVSIYGYDIRNEDGPPRARRRRRYGRGPNKYTRNWEDENAYRAMVKNAKPPARRRKDQEEFPPLDGSGRDGNWGRDNQNVESEEQYRNARNQNNNITAEIESNSRQPISHQAANQQHSVPAQRQAAEEGSSSQTNPPAGTHSCDPQPPANEKKQSDYRGFTISRQFRNSNVEHKMAPRGEKKGGRSRTREIEKDIGNLSLQEGAAKGNAKSGGGQRQGSVPPRLQAEQQKGSKRYSSLRQRSLPETAVPPFTQPANYFPNDYSQPQPSPPQQQQQAILQQPAPIHPGTPPTIAQIPPQPLPQIAQPPTTLMQPPPQYAAAYPAPTPTYLPAAVPPAQFIAQQAPAMIPPPPAPIINYIQGQTQYAQPPYPATFQHQQYNAVTQPAELYQMQGGTTYYSTETQQIRAMPQKRPKAAIPIVPPPPQEPRGRGRSAHQQVNQLDEERESVPNEDGAQYEDAVPVMVEQ